METITTFPNVTQTLYYAVSGSAPTRSAYITVMGYSVPNGGE
jgi:hypothetical protein